MSNFSEGTLAPLNFKPDWRQLEGKGDYSFSEMLGFPVLVMRCPFCDNEAPFPPVFLRKVEKRNPLTVVGEICCSCCDTSFTIRDGVAFGTSSRQRVHQPS